ncbi:MAG: ketopantoate reductase family protein [Betaproteobacteria bacterium]|nr:ketopantoate reductase family protein [Betaproteobacteria bacterium]
MNILVLGAGGIGGYFGGRLAEAGVDVTFLVREKRKAQLDRDGLRIESQYGHASIRVRSILAPALKPGYDCVLLTCKAYDLDGAMDAIAPAIGKDTFILPELNGIAHIDQLNARFSKDRVLGGTARIAATLTPEGVVKHLNDWNFITFGEQSGVMTPRVEALAALFNKSSAVKAKAVPNVMQEMWEKVVHLATAASMTCLMRAPVGDIVRSRFGGALMLQQLEAAAAIAKHNGHAPSDAFMQSYRELLSKTDSVYGTSMLRDIERGGPIEADHVIGFMVDKAIAAGVDDTLFRIAYTHLKAYENRRAAGRL